MQEFYGTYFHNITSHAPIQNCLINGRFADTEEQKRIFNAITKLPEQHLHSTLTISSQI